jgi:uncharacterized repeat protein (TIGR03843 family)
VNSDSALLHHLREAELDVVGRFVEASNVTLLARTGEGVQCVYKPAAGERPLWDFPAGTLGQREVASYELSRLLGWDLVPPTVLREDGPFGPGVCQSFVVAGADTAVDLVAGKRPPIAPGWLLVASGQGEDGEPVALVHRDDAQLRHLALFDLIANNADRKGGHILREASGAIRGIDHGLTFHEQDKLRTVLWGFAGRPLAGEERAALAMLRTSWEHAAQVLRPLLSAAEVAAAHVRLEAVLEAGEFPAPAPGWPRLPWPAL